MKYTRLNIFVTDIPKGGVIWDKILKLGRSKFCGRQPLKFTKSTLEYFVPFHCFFDIITIEDDVWGIITIEDGMWGIITIEDGMWGIITIEDGMSGIITIKDGMRGIITIEDGVWVISSIMRCHFQWKLETPLHVVLKSLRVQWYLRNTKTYWNQPDCISGSCFNDIRCHSVQKGIKLTLNVTHPWATPPKNEKFLQPPPNYSGLCLLNESVLLAICWKKEMEIFWVGSHYGYGLFKIILGQ